MYHVIYTLRTYLNLSQAKLAKAAGITQADVSEMENRPPYGHVAKYCRLAEYLGVPVEALAKNDYRAIPERFFEAHPTPVYTPAPTDPVHLLGRQGEEFILRRERERLKESYPALAHLVLPFYKMRCPSPGFDILTFDDAGQPFCLEVKTSATSNNAFHLTRNELAAAQELSQAGDRYLFCCISGWGTENQQVREISFPDFDRQYQCTPAGYVCCPKPKPGPVSGLAYYRQLRELRQEDISRALCVPQSDLSLYETGQRKAPITFYLKISELLDATVDQLLAHYDALPRKEAI